MGLLPESNKLLNNLWVTITTTTPKTKNVFHLYFKFNMAAFFKAGKGQTITPVCLSIFLTLINTKSK